MTTAPCGTGGGLALRPGTMLTNNLRLTQRVGRGGMGEVWRAENVRLRKQVAIKFASAELAKSESSIYERFEREAVVTAQIDSIHMVQIYDLAAMRDGTPYIVMELLEGHSLAEWLHLTERLTWRETRLIVSQVAKVLTQAHDVGIVHRDIKPDNIFLADCDYDMFVKVLDFGIAKEVTATRRLTEAGIALGTPEFMSPEQTIASRMVDHRSDLWSLGVVAYRCLTGALPFPEDRDKPLWYRVATGDFIPPSRLGLELPQGLDRWLEKALCPEPENRYASAAEMAEALARVFHAADDLNLSGDGSNLAARYDLMNDSLQPGQYDLYGPDSNDSVGVADTMRGEKSQRLSPRPFVGFKHRSSRPHNDNRPVASTRTGPRKRQVVLELPSAPEGATSAVTSPPKRPPRWRRVAIALVAFLVLLVVLLVTLRASSSQAHNSSLPLFDRPAALASGTAKTGVWVDHDGRPNPLEKR